MKFLNQLKERIGTLIAITTFVALITVATVYSTALSDEVEIQCDGEVIVVERSSKSVYAALADAGIFVDAFDKVNPGLDVRVEDVDCIIVERGITVNFTEADSTMAYKTNASTVAEFFEEKDITIGELDEITPELTQPITDGMTINLVRGDKLVKESVVQIPFSTEKRNNPELNQGQKNVIKSGQNGKKTVRTEITYRDGKEISRKVLSETVISEPVSAIVEIGTKIDPEAVAVAGSNVITAPDGTVYTYSKVITCNASAYDASYASNGKWGAVTATGKALRSGMVAVDPRVIPLGTKLYIEAPDGSWVYGYAVAEDTGGAIKGNKIDLFYPTRSAALQFGRRTANVYVLD